MWLGAYFETWASKWVSSGGMSDLAAITDFNVVYLAFVIPSTTYLAGQMTFANTGLQFSWDFAEVAKAIKVLQSRNVQVLLAVGGASYPFDGNFNPKSIAALAKDLGCNGVDIDWEPSGGASRATEFGPIISKLRGYLPRPWLLGAAVFSVGAYTNQPPQSQFTGMNIAGLKSNGEDLDYIGIMGYDAGSSYNLKDAVVAYRKIFSKTIVAGFEVGQQSWGGVVLTTPDFVSNAMAADGLFFWAYLKTASPDAKTLVKLVPYPQLPPVQPLPPPVTGSAPPPVVGSGCCACCKCCGGV